MIDMVMRKGKPGTGSGHEFMRRRTATIPWPDLRPILKGINWVIVGMVASRAYMPERMTQDLDILVRQTDGESVIKRLEQANYRAPSKMELPGFTMLSPDNKKLDVIFGNQPWLEEALRDPGKDPAGS